MSASSQILDPKIRKVRTSQALLWMTQSSLSAALCTLQTHLSSWPGAPIKRCLSYQMVNIAFEQKYVIIFFSIVNLLQSHTLQLGHSSCHLQHVTWLGKINPARTVRCTKLDKAGCSLLGHRILDLDKAGQDTRGGTWSKIWSISLQKKTGQRNHPGNRVQMSCPGRSKKITCWFMTLLSLTWDKWPKQSNQSCSQGRFGARQQLIWHRLKQYLTFLQSFILKHWPLKQWRCIG